MNSAWAWPLGLTLASLAFASSALPVPSSSSSGSLPGSDSDSLEYLDLDTDREALGSMPQLAMTWLEQASAGLLSMDGFAAVAAATGDHDELHADEPGLEKWLKSLTLHIPPIDDSGPGYELSIAGGSCNGIGLDGLDSHKEGEKLRVKANGISAGCSLKLSFTKIIRFLPNIHLDADITFNLTDSDIQGTVEYIMDGGSPPFPKEIRMPDSDCSANFQISDLQVSGNVLAKFVGLISGIVRRVLSAKLGPIICEQISEASSGVAAEALQNASTLARAWLAEPSKSPSKPEDLKDPNHDFLDFTQNPALPFVTRLFEKVLNNESSPHNFNACIDHFVGKGGVVSLDSILPFSQVVPVADLGEINVTIEQFSVGGLDNWRNLVADASDKHDISGGFSLSSVTSDVSLAIKVEPTCVPGKCSFSGGSLLESFRFNMSVESLDVSSAVFAALNTSHLSTLSVDQYGSIGCIAPALVSPLLTEADVKLGMVQTTLTPTGASAGIPLEVDLDTMLNFMIDDSLRIMAPTVQAVVSHAAGVTGRDFINDQLAAFLSDAKGQQCAAPLPTYANETLSKAALWTAVALILGGLLSLPVGMVVVKRREKKKMARSLVAAPRAEPLIGSEGQPDQSFSSSSAQSMVTVGQSTEEMDPNALSLAWHPRLDLGTRICIPMMVVAGLFLFLSSNSGAGAAVRVSVTVDGEDVAVLPPVASFSLISSVKDMWHGGVYPLAILILLFSGVWPYLKLILMLVCWFSPRSTLSLEARKKFLEFLDMYGKWSMVDTFVMVIFMVAFRFDLSGMGATSPFVAALFEEFGEDARLVIYVEASLGFHLFLLATVVSLALSHGMMACHRRACKLGEYGKAEVYNTRDALSGGRRRLCNILRPGDYWQGKVFVYGPFAAVAASLVLVMVGIFLETMAFKFLGLSGWVLGPEAALRPYSVVSLGWDLPQATMEPNSVGTRWLQVAYLCFAVVILPVYLTILLCLWAAPLSNKQQRDFLIAAQVLSAWSGLDVFCVSIIASVLEIRQFALFMVGDRCDLLNKILEALPISKEMEGGATCFDVVSELKPGLYILSAAAIIALVTGHITLRRCSDALTPSLPRRLSSIGEEDEAGLEGGRAVPFSESGASTGLPAVEAEQWLSGTGSSVAGAQAAAGPTALETTTGAAA